MDKRVTKSERPVTEYQSYRRRCFRDYIRAIGLIAAVCCGGVVRAETPAQRERSASSVTSSIAEFEGKRGIGVVRTFMFPVQHSSDRARYDVDPYVPRWSAAMPPALTKELLRVGFDFIRIAIEPGPLLDADSPTLKLRIGEITDAIDQSLQVGMKVLVDIHPSESHIRWNFRNLTDGPDNPAFRRLIEVMHSLAGALAKYDSRQVALEQDVYRINV